MGKDTKIEWTHHTFNPWWGCAKVSPACDNCYAETWAKRVGAQVWGTAAPRRFFSDTHWREPLQWNAAAAAAGVRERVFCASMADVFEKRRDLDISRQRLWNLIEETRSLDWLLLTKRPENILAMTPWGDKWPKNVWTGTTVENQMHAAVRLPHLLRVPSCVRFLSCEPLLGEIDLSAFVKPGGGRFPIEWVIVGGESGFSARPMNPAWARNLRKQCVTAKIPFHFKQWGHWAPEELLTEEQKRTAHKTLELEGQRFVAVGKYIAGRILDNQTWDGFPMSANALQPLAI
jgi:protein gp37